MHALRLIAAAALAAALLAGCGGDEQTQNPADPVAVHTQAAKDTGEDDPAHDPSDDAKTPKGKDEAGAGDTPTGKPSGKDHDDEKPSKPKDDKIAPVPEPDMEVPADLCAQIDPSLPEKWELAFPQSATYGSEAGERMATCTLTSKVTSTHRTDLFVTWVTAPDAKAAATGLTRQCETNLRDSSEGTFNEARCLGRSLPGTTGEPWVLLSRQNQRIPGVLTLRLDTDHDRFAQTRVQDLSALAATLTGPRDLLDGNG